jgi:NAD(P)H-hydrate repair Nnr-like enzyme with NAD(P)H-hydrate dehydratase domain
VAQGANDRGVKRARPVAPYGHRAAAPGVLDAIHRSGNAALATAGSGDVLSGLIGGLWAQGLSARDAALLATYRHGRVADLSARDRLVAADLLGA